MVKFVLRDSVVPPQFLSLNRFHQQFHDFVPEKVAAMIKAKIH